MGGLERLEEEILGQLNPRQREAVLDCSSTCVVNANVGSGKTTVLVAKLLYLYYMKNVSYSQMIVLTFTHKAAEEIRGRLEAREGRLPPEQLTGFGTFHSVAYRLLKQILPVEELGYTREFTVLLPEQELELARELIRREGYKIKYPARLPKRLEAAMRLGSQGRSSVEGKRLDKLQDDIWVLAGALEQEKKHRNTMTFRELLVHGETLLRKYPITPAWIVIDEVQDSDGQQLAFLDALRGRDTRLFAVGDPNQIIYGWRGSSINACFTLVHRYGARELTLPMNYRSGSRILEVAGRFKQYGDKLAVGRESGGQVRIRQAYDPLGEAYYLAEQIRLLQEKGVALEQIAVFYRLQAQGDILTDVFSREGICYQVVTRRERPVGETYLEEEGIAIYGKESGGSHVPSETAPEYNDRSLPIPSHEVDGMRRRQEESGSSSGVRLMTLHASKGLEFTYVFIIGVNYGLIPLHSAGFDEEEEERRLLFVGITRARDYLELSYYTQPGIPGVTPGESRYLQMIPERMVERVDITPVTETVNFSDKALYVEENVKTPSNPVMTAASALSGKRKISRHDRGNTAEKEDVDVEQTPIRRVRHAKYGLGTVTEESADGIKVDFGEMGVKSFLKDFVILETVAE